MTNLDSIFKSRDITLPTKVHLVKAMVFRGSCMDVRVGLWRKLSAEELMLLNCGAGKDSWGSLRLQGDPTSPFWRRSALGFLWNDAEAETPVLWPPHSKSWLIGKDYDAGRDCGQEEKRTTEDEMAGWHHWLDGRESEWTPGVGDGQGGLACCDSWGGKESDTTEQLNWTELNWNLKKMKIKLNYFNILFRFYLYLSLRQFISSPGNILFFGSVN